MKKTIRITLPIILTLVIVLCTIWYLFVYDREFTRDMLLHCARYSEQQGNHSVAAWFYDKAYSQTGDDDAVAIELANQYKANGNYTKAEYTLYNAIADGGGIDLYITLCKTYVEQDKLMDAVNMLDRITNPQIKAELEAMRPSAPTATPEPGFYSQYVPISIQSSSGSLYATSDGKYPSVLNGTCNQAIRPVDGENVIYALSIAENGLVSPLSILGYTIGGVVEEVKFTDPAVETAIRAALGAEGEKTLFTKDLWAVKSLQIPAEATNYTDLKYLTNLESLTIDSGIADELANIKSLSNLTELCIANTTVSPETLSAITKLPKLTKLTVQNCTLTNISALSYAKNLTYLNLSNNTIRNIDVLSGLVKLEELHLENNAIISLDAIAALSELHTLDVSSNALTSIAPIASLSKLAWLDAGTNSITQLGDLKGLTALTYLSLEYNQLTDISAVSGCTALTDLNISNNALTDLSVLTSLNQILYLNFSHNKVAALPSWSKDCTLVTIDGSHNLLKNIDSLAKLKQLNNVYMDYNEKLSSIKALASCPLLIQVDVYGTKVTDVKALTDQSVIVNYNPVQ